MIVIHRPLARRACALLSATLPLFIGCDNADTPGGGAGGAATTAGTASGGTPAGGGSVATAGSSAGSVTAGTSSGGNVASAGAAGSTAGGSAGAITGGVGGAAGSGSGGMAGAAGNAGAAGAGGAACGTIDKAGDGSYVRTGWTAEYKCTGGDCPAKGASDTGDVDTKAFDGNYSTRWSTGVYQSKLAEQGRFPLTFTVDMKKSAMISKLSTHPGCQDIYDAPFSIAVSVSTDGTTWTDLTPTPHEPVNPGNEACPPQANAKATDVITFPATCARYVRLTGTKRKVDDRYWAIGEMTVSP
jgi:hypothetical protein